MLLTTGQTDSAWCLNLRILAVKPFDEIAVPALRLVRYPAVALKQPVGQPLIKGVAEEGVGAFELGEGVERGERCSRRCVGGAERRNHVFERQEIGASPGLVVVEQTPIGLAARMVGCASWPDFGPGKNLGEGA